MKWLMESLLRRRANRLVTLLLTELPPSGQILDVGSGTGHNAAYLEEISALSVIETDVVDMHTVGSGPVVFDGSLLPFGDAAFTASIVLFVLQYAVDPKRLLREIHRVTSGRVLVLQSTYVGAVGHLVLSAWEFLSGRCAFLIARRLGMVEATGSSLQARRLWTRSNLEDIYRESGFVVCSVRPLDRWNFCMSRDLYVLERATK